MVSPLIAVDFGVPAPEPAAIELVLRACTLSVGKGRCVGTESPGAATAPMTARVTGLATEWPAVLIEVVVLGPGGPEPHLQRIDFATDDVEAERWEAVGLAIGTLAEPPARIPPASDGAKPNEPAERDWHPVWLSVRGSYGTGFRGSANAMGIGFGAAYAVRQIPVFSAVTVSTRHALRGAVRGEWRELEVGVGGHIAAGPVMLRAAAELVTQQLAAEAFNTSTGRVESGSQVSLGVGLGADLAWPSDGRGALCVGGRAIAMRHPTTVNLEGKTAAVNPAELFMGYVGLEVRF